MSGGGGVGGGGGGVGGVGGGGGGLALTGSPHLTAPGIYNWWNHLQHRRCF